MVLSKIRQNRKGKTMFFSAIVFVCLFALGIKFFFQTISEVKKEDWFLHYDHRSQWKVYSSWRMYINVSVVNFLLAVVAWLGFSFFYFIPASLLMIFGVVLLSSYRRFVFDQKREEMRRKIRRVDSDGSQTPPM